MRLRSLHLLALSGIAPPVLALTCTADAGARTPWVVELYTSQGCSSCPPADRWLSSLKPSARVIPLSFHVNYWNRLGWPDPFASPEATQRQYEWARTLGARNVYTPQVIAGGRDWRAWPRLPEGAPVAPMALTLRRDGARATVDVGAASGRWQGYWAVLEDGHRSRVTAGENDGKTLAHDHVVRHYQPLPAWSGAAQRLELQVPAAEAGRPQRVVFVVEDAATRRPVQAVACP